MKESIHIYNPAHASVEFRIWGLMALSYIVTLNHESEERSHISAFPHPGEEMDTMTTSYSGAKQPRYGSSDPIIRRQSSSPPAPMMRRNHTSVPQGSNCVTIRVAMPSNSGFRSWRWYEALIETKPKLCTCFRIVHFAIGRSRGV